MWLGFKKKNYAPSQVKKICYLALCKKKSENIKKNCVKKYTFNKKRSEESSRNVCSADREDSLGKEKLYLRKITIIDV